MITMNGQAKCDECGRFFQWREPGSAWVFVPDTPFTYEESRDVCARCVAEHGRPLPQQTSVRVDMCSGVQP